jgi:CHRD domain
MKKTFLTLASVVCLVAANAAIIPFDLSPAGTSPAIGLSPANEVPAVTNSTGSGGEILTGITFDTATLTLSFAMGYGSVAGFTDLTSAGTGFHIHGPAPTTNNAPVVLDLGTNQLPAGDPAKGGVLLGSIVLTDEQMTNLLAGLYYVNIHTATNPAGEIRGQLIALQNEPPTITCVDPVTVECTSSNGTPVRLPVTVADADGDALTVVWTLDGAPYQTNQVPAGTPTTSANVPFHASFGIGAHDVVVTVTDAKGISTTCTTTVTVQDTTPPVIRRVIASPNVLWPANHKMVPVRISVLATDACCQVRSRIVGVRCNEAVNATGDGNTSPDWEITGPLTLKLRAERAGKGSGRIYYITVQSTDCAGNTTMGRTIVTVPHDQGSKR